MEPPLDPLCWCNGKTIRSWAYPTPFGRGTHVTSQCCLYESGILFYLQNMCAFLWCILYLNMLEPEIWLWRIVRTSEGSNSTVNSVFFLSYIGWVEVQFGATVVRHFAGMGDLRAWPSTRQRSPSIGTTNWCSMKSGGVGRGGDWFMVSWSTCVRFLYVYVLRIFSFVICHVVFCIFWSCLKFEEAHPRPTSSWWSQRQLVHHNDMLICLYDG